MEPGEVYQITVDMWDTGNLFRGGPHDPPGGVQQQLPALRAQPEYRLAAGTRRRRGRRAPDRLPRPSPAVPPDPSRRAGGLTHGARG